MSAAWFALPMMCIFFAGCESKQVIQTDRESTFVVPEFQQQARIGRCVNMANHLEAPNEGEWGRKIKDTDFKEIAEVGFSAVRIPVRFSAHAEAHSPYHIDESFMSRVIHVVNLAIAVDLHVVLNIHHYEEIFEDPDAHKERFVALWAQISERFQSLPDSVWFELLNEPHKSINNQNLMGILAPVLAEVRKYNATRKVVIGGEDWSGIDSLATLPLPDDDNIIATFHYYEPFNFTHQGATWVDDIPPLGTKFGSEKDRLELQEHVNLAYQFMLDRKVPVWIGEFGAHSTVTLDERAEYYKAVDKAFQKIGVDGCAWGYTNGFPIRTQEGQWHQGLLQSLGLGLE